jgi:hypothetical protein
LRRERGPSFWMSVHTSPEATEGPLYPADNYTGDKPPLVCSSVAHKRSWIAVWVSRIDELAKRELHISYPQPSVHHDCKGFDSIRAGRGRRPRWVGNWSSPAAPPHQQPLARH